MTKEHTLVIILPDHGTRYLAKVYNDSWMESQGFLETGDYATASDIVKTFPASRKLLHVSPHDLVEKAMTVLKNKSISQLPVLAEGLVVGSITDSNILKHLIDNPDIRSERVENIMENPFPFVGLSSTLDVLSSLICNGNKALLVRDQKEEVHIITQADLISAMQG